MGAGVVYGFYYRASLKSEAKANETAAKFTKTEKLINEAKEKFASLNKKDEGSSTDLSKINLDDKNLDFAKVILSSIETLK